MNFQAFTLRDVNCKSDLVLGLGKHSTGLSASLRYSLLPNFVKGVVIH